MHYLERDQQQERHAISRKERKHIYYMDIKLLLLGFNIYSGVNHTPPPPTLHTIKSIFDLGGLVQGRGGGEVSLSHIKHMALIIHLHSALCIQYSRTLESPPRTSLLSFQGLVNANWKSSLCCVSPHIST